MNTNIRKILIVDDSTKDVELTIAALSQNNLANEVVVAEDGIEALDYLYRRGKYSNHADGNPVVILLDIKMPKMDGIQLLQYIRSEPEFKFIPIIILTSSREEKDLIESYKLGANSFVVKPVDIVQFIESIKSLGQYWAVINQLPTSR